MKQGFDHQIYIEQQSRYILERVKGWDKLYLEFGGKLMYDLHAKRCLPGYRENAKLELLQSLGDQAEILICVYAGDIQHNKRRGDFGTTYEMEVLKLIDDLRGLGLAVNSVVITRYEGQSAARIFANKLESRGITRVEIRTVLTCRAKSGVCAKCYGMNLASGKPVGTGEAVGIWSWPTM